MNNSITILLPVYGRSCLLSQALQSVYAQDDPDWRLLIADDGSDVHTAEYLLSQTGDPRVQVIRNNQNLGLFGNLNTAITHVKTSWQLLLCSDDLLEPHAIRSLKSSIMSTPAAKLILSSYRSIDIAGQLRTDVNGIYYDRFAPITHLFPPGALLKPLLQYGSINGNITGMLIHQSLFSSAGLWRADWSQSADWEWLTRSCIHTSVLVSRDPVARVRVHPGQLSVSNRKLQRENLESLQVLAELISHPMLQDCPQRFRWAAHHSQFLLWNAVKAFPRVGFKQTTYQLWLIHVYVGLVTTVLAFFSTIPRRLSIRGTNSPLLPPT